MHRLRAITALLTLAAAATALAGCRAGVRTAPPAAPSASEARRSPGAAASGGTALARLGYTVQVGAFVLDRNARDLTERLTAAGLDAFYFRDKSGFFKVRFGDFPSKDTALAGARSLEAKGLVRDYFVVGPGDHALAGPRPSTAAAGKPGSSAIDLRERLAATAESFIGVDYEWGGTTARSGFDCSGLVLAVYRLNGLAMPRSVREQFNAGSAVPRDALMKGDLVFFSASPAGGLSHVGIYVGGGAFIHAPGSGRNVRRESLGSGYFRARFSGARAYLR